VSLSADLLDYVKNCRIPMSRFEIADDLARLGAHGAEWPRASANQWNNAIRVAIANGELIEVDNVVRLPQEESQKPAQLSLF
jgi:hypothetical protein